MRRSRCFPRCTRTAHQDRFLPEDLPRLGPHRTRIRYMQHWIKRRTQSSNCSSHTRLPAGNTPIASSKAIPAVELSCVGPSEIPTQWRCTNSTTEAFERKVQESGKGMAIFNIEAFFAPSPKTQLPALTPSEESALWTPPSRLHSDQMVNIFFQEWAPLFPVLHRPTFLDLYHQYTTNASNIQGKKSLAQLNLVFGIAALSNEVCSHQISISVVDLTRLVPHRPQRRAVRATVVNSARHFREGVLNDHTSMPHPCSDLLYPER